MKRPWKLAYQKLFYFQKKIQSKKNARLCRNFQRFLHRNHFIQLLVIHEVNIDFLKFKSKKYRIFLTFQILSRLWILSLLPIYQNSQTLRSSAISTRHLRQSGRPSGYSYLQQRELSQPCVLSEKGEASLAQPEGEASLTTPNFQIYRILYTFFKNPNIQYIFINKFKNTLSQKNKFWILSNILIEKKFFFAWLKKEAFAVKQTNHLQGYSRTATFWAKRAKLRSPSQKVARAKLRSPQLCEAPCLSVQHFLNLSLISRFPQTLYFLEYNNFLIIPFNTEIEIKQINKYLNNYIRTQGSQIKLCESYVLNKGFCFLGWFFKKESPSFFLGRISNRNLRSHQKELKLLLKQSQNQPVDKIIYSLNRKILRWQKFYSCSMQLSKTWSQMNDFLFWLIWHWIQKRHRNKGSKWLYIHYWKKVTSKGYGRRQKIALGLGGASHHTKWVFVSNNQTLVFYKL
uniref:Group II intron maturase-specific domain-containing protein n=1 Tax=Rhipiliopsis peltata TaxID=2320810 RepID=A0A386B177_9CHLO|nr:hypothetical protein [Rhipiliopsis peltata]AYC65454.1 hypothetical protein [Rhipiliopsis peltata]